MIKVRAVVIDSMWWIDLFIWIRPPPPLKKEEEGEGGRRVVTFLFELNKGLLLIRSADKSIYHC